MKKILIVSLAVLLLAGCAALQSAGEYVGALAEKVCDFSVAESAEAQMSVAFISAAAPIVGVVTGVDITQAQAQAVLTTVAAAAQTGACVLLTDLANALAFVDALAAQYDKAMAARGPLAARAAPPDLAALKARVRK